MAPIASALIVGYGWANALQVLGLIVLLALPAAFLLKGNARHSARRPARRRSAPARRCALRGATRTT